MTPSVLLPAWYVAFVPGRGHWWQRFLKPGFGHCYAFGWDAPGDRWLLFAWGLDGIAVRSMPHAWFPAFLAAVQAEGATVLLAKSHQTPVTRLRLLSTCVTAIAALLGLPVRRALTPYALYRTLLAHGAVPVMEN